MTHENSTDGALTEPSGSSMPETIYLLPNEGYEGETLWSHDIPTEEHEADAVEYTRHDKYEALRTSHDRLVEALERLVEWELAIETVAPELGGLLKAIYGAKEALTEAEAQRVEALAETFVEAPTKKVSGK